MTEATERICIIEGCTRRAEPRRKKCGICKYSMCRRRAVDSHEDQIIDPIDVEIAVRDRRPVPGMTYAGRRHVTRLLTLQGLSTAQIAIILAVNKRSVTRYRRADRHGWKGTTQ
jgi:hypothetical protein